MGGQAKYDVMMVFCGDTLQQHHKTLKISTTGVPKDNAMKKGVGRGQVKMYSKKMS